MELVLSPGRLGGSDGSGVPFQNEEVREWSHVDRLTGMLERARIETGRWQARNQGAAQAYGKVIDSRERNSADGSVVQKARRQVEVFQSQGAGGRSVQVVRASQWSSSRVTDSTSSSPVPISMNEAHHKNGIEDAPDASESIFGKLKQEDSGLSRLTQVSRLCRQIHAEAVQNIRSSASLKTNTPPATPRYVKPYDVTEDRNSPSFLNGKKSTSNEDISNTNEKDDTNTPAKFTRDCKARRSLQIPKTLNLPAGKMFDDKSTNSSSVRLTAFDHRSKFSVHEAETVKDFDGYPRKTRLESNCTRKLNVPAGRQIKSYVLGMESCVNGGSPEASDVESHRGSAYSFKSSTDQRNKDAVECESYSDYLRPVPISPGSFRSVRSTSSGKANTTVVHLRNSSLPRQENSSQLKETIMTVRSNGVKAVAVPMGTVQCRIQSSGKRYSPRNSLTRESEVLKFKEEQLVDDNSAGSVRLQHSKGLLSERALLSDDLETSRHSAILSNDIILRDISSDKNRVLEDEQIVLPSRLVKKAGFNKPSDTKIQPSNHYSPRNSLTRESEPLKYKDDQQSKILLPDERHSAVVTSDENLHDVSPDKSLLPEDEQTIAPGRLVKKVGFSKTEVHFAADSGKVNIVMSDGKPPPTNKFRRRRRNSLVSGTPNDKNLPLIHFGDTSYEKFIFGQSNVDKSASISSTESNWMQKRPDPEMPGKLSSNDAAGWGVRLRSILEPGHNNSTAGVEFCSKKNYEIVDKIVNDQKHRGHTTTVNFGTDVTGKAKHIEQGNGNAISTGIHLRFDTQCKSLYSIPLEATEYSPPKIAVHVTPKVSKISRPLVHTLKSTSLVLNLNRISHANPVTKVNVVDGIPTMKHSFRSLPSATDLVLSHNVSDIVNNNCSQKFAAYRSRFSGGIIRSARFTSLQSKVPNRFGCTTCKKSVDVKEERENQLQYSSGSEQADEEVRSYMLGSTDEHQEQIQRQEFARITAVEERKASPALLKSTEAAGSDPVPRKEDSNACIVEAGLKSVDELLVTDNSNSLTPPSPYPRQGPEESPLLASTNDTNVVSSDNENNQVLLNVVTTHEPIIARVEKDHSTKHGVSHSSEREARSNLTRASRRTGSANPRSTSVKLKAKDFCDSNTVLRAQGDSKDDALGLTDPTYVNVFEAAQEDAPVYENCQLANEDLVKDEYHAQNGVVDACLLELRQVTDNALKAMNGVHGSAFDNSSQSSTEGEEDRPRKSRGFVKQNLTTISENKSSSGTKFHAENHRARSSKARSERPVGPTSSTSSIESASRSPSRVAKSRETKYSSGKSCRTKERESVAESGRKTGNQKESQDEENVEKTRARMTHSKRHSNLPAKSADASKVSNGSTRSKKPIEIVYQTAVFNMKNEKLSKPSKVKESKSPRYINDLICGGKSKRPVEGRHVKDTGSERMGSQTSHRLQFLPSSSKKSPH